MFFSLTKLFNPDHFRSYLSQKQEAINLSAFDSNDIKKAAVIVKQGGIVAFPFNGVYGLFGDVNNKKVIEKINKAKGRPQDKKLIIVSLPELIHEFFDFKKMPYTHNQLKEIWRELHALGIMAPPNRKVAKHITNIGDDANLIAIWTEYQPMRSLIKEFQKLGGTALFGTSANKTGYSTHTQTETVWRDFKNDVNAIVEANFDHLPQHRKKSTTIVDMTKEIPTLFRPGNVKTTEIQKVFKKLGLNDLFIPKMQKINS